MCPCTPIAVDVWHFFLQMVSSETIAPVEPIIDNKKSKITKKKRKRVPNNTQKIHQCDTCGKTFNRREYLTQHIRIHTGKHIHDPHNVDAL